MVRDFGSRSEVRGRDFSIIVWLLSVVCFAGGGAGYAQEITWQDVMVIEEGLSSLMTETETETDFAAVFGHVEGGGDDGEEGGAVLQELMAPMLMGVMLPPVVAPP